MQRVSGSSATAAIVAVVIGLGIAYALTRAGVSVAAALVLGALVSGLLCLAVSLGQHLEGWAIPGLLALSAALVAWLVWRGLANWWWPLSLVAAGVAFLPLAEALPGRLARSWQDALRFSAPLVAGVGAVWELGQVLLAVILLDQGTPLLAEDAGALETSFLVSSFLLVAGALLWASLRRQVLALALLGALAAELAVALVLPTILSGDPGAALLLGLALVVVALACHAGTYPLRLVRPELAPGAGPSILQLLLRRHAAGQGQSAWGCCLLLDLEALILVVWAAVPVGNLPAADNPNTSVLLIALLAGMLLSSASAYWLAVPWLLLLAGFFQTVGLLVWGALVAHPTNFWPLAYLVATVGWLGLALWLGRWVSRSGGLVALLVALGQAGLAVAFAFHHQSLIWEVGIAAGVAISLLSWMSARRRLAASVKGP